MAYSRFRDTFLFLLRFISYSASSSVTRSFTSLTSITSSNTSSSDPVEPCLTTFQFSPDQDGLQLTITSPTMANVLTQQDCPPDDPDDVRYRQLFAIVPAIVIMVLSTLTFGLRLFCRRKTGQKLWWDDYLMGAGLIISFMPSICEFFCKLNIREVRSIPSNSFAVVQDGLGHHICNIPAAERAHFARVSTQAIALT